MLTWKLEYFLIIFSVSSSVRKEFIRTRGTSVLYLQHKVGSGYLAVYNDSSIIFTVC